MTKATTLREDDNGRTITLKPGDQVTVDLHESAGSGYRWTLEASDARVADVREGQFTGESDKIGAGGRTRWTIKAVAPGTAELRGKRWRQWEGDSSVQERYAVTLQVRR